MSKLQTVNFRPAVQSLKTKGLNPFYLLMGEDQFLQSLFVKLALQVQFAGENPVKKILNPDEMNGREILNELNSIDLFHSKKMFLVKNPTAINQKYKDEFLEYCRNPIKSNCLILSLDEWGLQNSFTKSLTAISIPISCSTPLEKDLEKWIDYFFKENNFNSIPRDIVKYLIDIGGDSLYHLKNEIDKICISLDNAEDLTQDYVTQFSGWKRDYRKFELYKALGERNLPRAILMGKTLIDKNTTMLSLLYPLTEFFQELLYLKLKGGTNQKSYGYTRLSIPVKRNLPIYEKHYSKQEVQAAIRLLGKIDRQIKLSQISDEAAITKFIFTTLDNG